MNKWLELKLSEIGTFKSSGVDKVVTPGEKIVRLVNYMDVYRSNMIYYSQRLAETSATNHEIDSFDLQKGDVLFTPTSETPDDIGHSSVVLEDMPNTLYSYHLTRFRENSKKYLDDTFKAFVFNQTFVLKQFELKAAGSTRFTLTKGSFESTIIKFPENKSEQKKIAQILSTTDTVIEKTQAAIAKYKAIKQGMLNDLFTRGIDTKSGKLRPKQEDAPHLYKESELGWIPKEWDEEESKSVVNFINGRAYSIHEWESNGTPVIRLQNLTGSGENYYYSNLVLPESQYCKKGDLLYMWSATFGPHIWKGDKAIFHYHIWKVECSKRINQTYFYYELLRFTETVLNGSNGSTMAHITKLGMDKRLINVPSIPEQEFILNRLLSIDKQLQTEQNYLQKLQQIKSGLMADLLSGKKLVTVNKVVETQTN